MVSFYLGCAQNGRLCFLCHSGMSTSALLTMIVDKEQEEVYNDSIVAGAYLCTAFLLYK